MSALDIAPEPPKPPRPSPVARLLDARDWAYHTRTFDALGFVFAIRTSDPVLGAHLDGVYASLATDAPPSHLYSVVERGEKARRPFSVFLDGRRADALSSAAQTLRYIVWHINQEVSRRAEPLLFHASAVSYAGRGAMFAGMPASGKSTLATALVRAGCRYVTDEAVAFDEAGVLVPYPKPISLDSGSWPLFPDLSPAYPAELERYVGKQWLLPPEAIRPASQSEPCRVALVVKLHYDPDRPTTLETISRARVMPHLIEQSFNFHRLGRAALARVAGIVGDAECVEMTVNNLDEACAEVISRLDNARDTTPQ